MTNAQLTSLTNGGNITRFSTLEAAQNQATRQVYLTCIILGCDGRFWVPATPRIARQLKAAGYEAAE